MRQLGLTLVEMMTVLAIAAVLALAAVPSFVSLLATHRLRSAAVNLHQALLIARSESLKRNAKVQLAPLATDRWNSGWRVINVADHSLIASYPPAEALEIAGPAEVTYQASGRIGATTMAVFKISSRQVADIRCVTVNVGGMPAVSASGC